MSSSNEPSIQGDSFGAEGGKPADLRPTGRGLGLGLGLELGLPCSGEGEGGLRNFEACEFDFEMEWKEIEARRAVLRGCEGRPGSLADEKGDLQDFMPYLTAESEAIMQQLTGPETWGALRYPSPESFAAEASAIWVDAEAGFSTIGVLAPSCVEVQQASAALPSHPSGPEGTQAQEKPKRGTKSRMMGSGEAQQPSSDSESSDEFSEVLLRKVNICWPRELGDPARCSSVHNRENFLHMLGPLLTSTPHGLTSAMERQASAELKANTSKQMQSLLWGKGRSRPSYPGAAAAASSSSSTATAAAAAAAGGLPRATPRKKAIQEKKSLGGGWRVTPGRAFPSSGQRLKVTPLEPATFPPILGVQLLGRSKRYSLLPLEPKQSRHSGTGKRTVAKKTRESEPVTSEASNPNRDVLPQAQDGKLRVFVVKTENKKAPGLGLSKRDSAGELSAHRLRTPCLHMHCGKISGGEPNTRVPQPPGSSQPLDSSQGVPTPRGLAPSGDQDPPVQVPVLKRQQQPPGAQGCPRCVVLQKEIDDLKEQLAVMHSLADKFQDLGI